MGRDKVGDKKIQLPLVFVLLLVSALDQRHQFNFGNMDASLWTSPSSSSKGGGSGSAGGKSPPIGGGGQKGQKRSQSGGPKGDSSGGGGGSKGKPRAAKGGYVFSNDPLKPRLPPHTWPWGTGATKANLELFANGSEYPGLAQSADHSISSIPELYEWYPCLNEKCPSPSRQTPPFGRAGVSNFSVVSNSQVKCKFCFVQYVPVKSQRVVAMFQAPLVEKLGGSLGPLHPKFAGSKLYGQAELALQTNEDNFDPNKPPVFPEGSFSLPSPAEWLAANTNIGNVQRARSGPSLDAALTARASLARLDNAIANGETASLDFAKLSRAASASSLAPTSTQDAGASSFCTPDVGIFRYLQTAIQNAKSWGEDSLAAALEFKLQKDFPDGEPEPPKAPAPPIVQLSAPNELNLLATKQAQALRELLASRASLDVAKDKVISCQAALNEAKELATKAAAQVAISASNYEQAGLAVKAFNDKVQQTELAAAAAASAELTAATLKATKIEAKTEEPTYAAVVKGVSKGKVSKDSAAPVLPVSGARKAEEEPDMDGDKAMGGASNHSGSQHTTASKRIKKLADARKQERLNDYTETGKLLLNPELASDSAWLQTLEAICQKYDLEPTAVLQAAEKQENLVMVTIKQQDDAADL